MIPDDPRLAGLLLATARGDQPAFARLYQATSPQLLAVILRILRRRSLAEEVLQEVYLRIWREARAYQANRGAPMAWMVTIARNRAFDSWRKEHRAPLVQDPTDQELALDWGDAGEITRALKQCLEGLEGRQRQVVLLAYLEGYSHDELAKRLNRPLGTVKSWIRRAVLRLKACLEP